MKSLINSILRAKGYKLVKTDKYGNPVTPDIVDAEFLELYELCAPYTMTSVERLYALYQGCKFVLDQNIPGDFVECGVWRGGSSLLMAKMLANRGIQNRKLYLYDTFEGMSNPGCADVDLEGKKAKDLMDDSESDKEESVWCLASLEDVQKNMSLSGVQAENLVYQKGKVEDTIPAHIPEKEIALLRLDTDWYESTKHELEHLYPKLSKGGVMILDDYGHWQGCRKAVDEYFKTNGNPILLNRIDYTGRMAVKIH